MTGHKPVCISDVRKKTSALPNFLVIEKVYSEGFFDIFAQFCNTKNFHYNLLYSVFSF